MLHATDAQLTVQASQAQRNAREVKTTEPWGALRQPRAGVGLHGQWYEATQHYLLGSGYRCFGPALRRFMASDRLSPFGAGGTNSYAFCHADPVNYSDNSGAIAVAKLLRVAERTRLRMLIPADKIIARTSKEIRNAKKIIKNSELKSSIASDIYLYKWREHVSARAPRTEDLFNILSEKTRALFPQGPTSTNAIENVQYVSNRIMLPDLAPQRFKNQGTSKILLTAQHRMFLHRYNVDETILPGLEKASSINVWLTDNVNRIEEALARQAT